MDLSKLPNLGTQDLIGIYNKKDSKGETKIKIST